MLLNGYIMALEQLRDDLLRLVMVQTSTPEYALPFTTVALLELFAVFFVDVGLSTGRRLVLPLFAIF